jgi:uncharacterized protein (TIGR02302 family)
MTEPQKPSDEHSSTMPAVSRQLSRSRIATRLAIVAERLWPLVVPLAIVICLFLAASWFGVFRSLPDWLRFGLAGLFGICGLATFYPLRFYRTPTSGEIDRRIEHANQLRHTPVLAQTDRLGGKPDRFADALWREHQNRMARQLRDVSADAPRSGMPERDPWGLRAVAPLLALIALAFSYAPFGGQVRDAFNAAPGVAPLPPRIDAWIAPPAYTGKPPLFLTAENNRDVALFTAPVGSELTVRVTGGHGGETLGFEAGGLERAIEPTASLGGSAQPEIAGGPTSTPRQFNGKLMSDGGLVLRSGEQTLARWAFRITPDTPPTIRFSNQPRRVANGALELHYEIKDDYGAASAAGELTLADPQKPDARPLYDKPELPLALPRRGSGPSIGKTTRDLSEHVWAGARVTLTLTAEDAAQQKAHSEPATFTLPQRTFTNPLAKAVIEMRRLIALDANEKSWAMKLLDAITLRPEDTFDAMSNYLAIMSARTRLDLAQTDDELRGVVDYLWEVALGIEDGALSTAEKRLQQAQEELKQALERGASDEEIEKLMKELREAMNDFLREFAERAMKNQNFADQQSSQELRKSDLDRLMDEIEKNAKSGNRDKAQEMLSQLEQMMQNLQAMRGQQGENGQQSEMRQQMNKLGEIMRRQQEMMNETFRTERGQRQGQQGEQGESQQGQPGEGQSGEHGQQPGQGGRPMTPEEFADAMKQLQEDQGQLQQELGALGESLRGLGMQPGDGFGEAGREMGQAGEALGSEQGERATGHQGRALEALRKGAQDLMQQMQQAMQGNEGGSENGGRQQNADRDPLGRPRATTGPDFGDSVKVPDEIDVQRARRILEAIRERLGNALSPELEKQYLERLLEMK